MGLIYFEQKQYEQAVIEFAKATNEKPDAIEGSNSYLSCYYAGQCREKQHRMDEAKEFYWKAGNYEPAKERLERIGWFRLDFYSKHEEERKKSPDVGMNV